MNKSKLILSPSEERELLGRIKQDNDGVSTKKFIESFQFLVASVVIHYPNKQKSFNVLMKAGNTGLEKAIKHYKLSYKFRFSTYATWWIRAEIHKELGLPVDPEKLV